MEFKAVKDAAKTVLVIVFLLFMGLSIYLTLFGIGSGRITVFVNDGRYSTKYKTDKVLNDGPRCIKFKVGSDTVRACGSYKVMY
jgi:hypothetical protein